MFGPYRPNLSLRLSLAVPSSPPARPRPVSSSSTAASRALALLHITSPLPPNVHLASALTPSSLWSLPPLPLLEGAALPRSFLFRRGYLCLSCPSNAPPFHPPTAPLRSPTLGVVVYRPSLPAPTLAVPYSTDVSVLCSRLPPSLAPPPPPPFQSLALFALSSISPRAPFLCHSFLPFFLKPGHSLSHPPLA